MKTPGGPARARTHPRLATGWADASAWAVSRLGSPLPLLLALSLVQGLLWLWSTFGVVDQRIAPAHALTLLGAGVYHPDRDMPIYVAGTLACVLLDTLLATVLKRMSPAADLPAAARTEFVACAAVVLLPSIAPDARPAYLAACALGLGLVAWRLRVRWRLPSPRLRAPVPVPDEPLDAPGLRDDPGRPGSARRFAALVLDSILPMAILALLVLVPWPQALLWRAFEGDRFHHIDFYAMAPALAHAHGLRLATDFYSQYGLGWPVVLDWIGRAKGSLGYTTFLRLEVLVGCAYFLALYFFLRAWLRSASWAIAGLLLALLLALFTDTAEGPKWLWPSSTVMRYAFDVSFFAVLLAHLRSGDARLGPLAGGVLALQLVFSSDVGLYLLLAFAIYLVCAARRPPRALPRRSVTGFALGAGASLLVVAGVGFTIANQGELPGRVFWSGLTESLFAYGGGIGNLPIASELGNRESFDLLLLAVLATYFRCLATALSACLERTMSPTCSLRAAIAAYGLGTLVLFIGRSHHENLMHVSIPFCLLVASFARSADRAAVAGRARPRMAPQHLLSLGLLVAIGVQAARIGYPNVIDVALGAARTDGPGPTWTSRAGDRMPIDSPAAEAEFRAASQAIRQASDGGLHTVAVIGTSETAYLLEAGVAPYFRYSPVLANLVYQEQTAAVTRRIEAAPPDWIFIAVDGERSLYGTTSGDVVRAILAVVERGYVRRGSAGHFAVYGKAAAPAPAPANRAPP